MVVYVTGVHLPEMKMKCGCANSSQQRLMNYERYNKLPTLAELGVEIEEKYDGSENEVRFLLISVSV